MRWEIPQLCREAVRVLTSSGITVRWPGKDPSPGPRPLVKARGAVHPLPWERENPVFSAPVRAMIYSLSLGERAGVVLGALPRAESFSLSLGERGDRKAEGGPTFCTSWG